MHMLLTVLLLHAGCVLACELDFEPFLLSLGLVEGGCCCRRLSSVALLYLVHLLLKSASLLVERGGLALYGNLVLCEGEGCGLLEPSDFVSEPGVARRCRFDPLLGWALRTVSGVARVVDSLLGPRMLWNLATKRRRSRAWRRASGPRGSRWLRLRWLTLRSHAVRDCRVRRASEP